MKQPKIQPYLQVSVAFLVFISTLLLGMGQLSIFYPVFALLAAIFSVLFVDFRQKFHLSQNGSRTWALVVVAVLIFQMARNVEQSQLLNVANILVFLQAILLFQKKTNLVYWELISLSMLQVAVAAALNLGFMFGVLLIVYMLAGVLTLALFYVFREIESLKDTSNPENRFGQLSWHCHEDVSGFVVERSFLGRLAWLAVFSLLGAVLLFFAIPRFNNQVWRNQQTEQLTSVGYTEEVELDDIGEILENPEEVMRVEFTNLDRTPYEFSVEPYFRGTVLSEFHSGKEVWRHLQFSNERKDFNSVRSPDLSTVVVQKTTLQPGRHAVLFNVAPCYKLVDRNHPDFLLNQHTRQLIFAKERSIRKKPVRYEIATSGIRGQNQTSWLPILNNYLENVSETPETGQLNQHRRRLLFPFTEKQYVRSFQPLADLATRVLTDNGLLPTASSIEKARCLERFFLNSNEYTYSLKGVGRRSRNVKAIVDFAINHKSGHCEFFASALALMLRSQDVPARLVIGYKGGDYNGVGNFFTVRQLHCHAWVEAYIPDAEIPAGAIPANEYRDNGAWLRLDSTPSRSQIIANTDQIPILTTMKEFVDYCQVLWDDYVLGLNSQRQQQSIYQPLMSTVQDVGVFMFSKRRWTARMNWIRRQVHGFITGRWITWQTFILLAILVPLVYFIRDYLRALFRRLIEILPVRARRLLRTKRGEMIYDQLEAILAKQGFRRSSAQTQHDFTMKVTDELQKQGAISGEHVPQRIAAAFYRVRFGSQTLSDSEFQQLEDSLRQFELDLNAKP